MNKDVKEKWVRALRSGEYEQTGGALAKPTDLGGINYCCLGVLCELAVAEGVVTRHMTNPISRMAYINYGNRRETQELPDEVIEWAGLIGRDPSIQDGDEPSSLAFANDGGMNFDQIADLIEEQL